MAVQSIRALRMLWFNMHKLVIERDRRMKRNMFAAIVAVALSLMALRVAFAHAQIDHCTPAVGSIVAQTPGQVVCVMTEEIDTKLSTLSVWDASGNQVDRQDAHVDLNDPDHKTLIVSLDATKITTGLLTVKYHTVTPDDGGITDGTFQFVVGSAAAKPAPVSAVESQGPTPTPQAVAATPASPATLPQSGASQVNIGLIVVLSGVIVVGSGLAIRRLTH
jgi:methionine-rich copper-binding protein CopC